MTTPFLFARIAAGRTDLILDVLAAASDGAPLPSTEQVSLLQWSAYYGDVTAVRCLQRHGVGLAGLGPDLGLNAAAFHGHWQVCQFLLENGADVRRADPDTGETALHSALTNEDRLRYDLVVRVLLAAGADVAATTAAGAPTGSFMRDCRTRAETPLHRAAAFGSADTVRLLLEAGADPSRRDQNGDTPLAWASWYRRPLEILRPLVFGSHTIHPAAATMRDSLLGRPLAERLHGEKPT